MSWKNNEIKLSSKPQHDFLLLKKQKINYLWNVFIILKKKIKIKNKLKNEYENLF